MPTPTPGTSSFQARLSTMEDAQLKATISQLSAAAAQTQYTNFRAPVAVHAGELCDTSLN